MHNRTLTNIMTRFRNIRSTLLGKMAGAAFVLALGAGAAQAAIHWDSTEAVLRIDDTKKTGQARFTFTNTGTTPVDILLVRPDCGCTVALPAKTHFGPGEKGEIPVEFSRGSRTGPQRIGIDVTTSDAGEPTRLMFVVEIGAMGANGVPTALHWDSTEAVLRIDDTKKTGQARFTFTNTSTTPVDILQVHPECGCTAALPAKTHFEPGEKGEVQVEFRHDGMRTGTIRIPIDVTTSDVKQPTQLMFLVEIETLVALKTHAIFWRAEQAREPRAVRITVSAEKPVKLVSASCSDPGLSAKLVPVAGSAREFDLVVTPPPAGIVVGKVELHALLGQEQAERTYTILARTL
jgi:hypothetical protein